MSNALKDTEHEARAERRIREFLSPSSGVHGVLFYGSENAPLAETANRLAQGWLCLNVKNGAPCGECRSCSAFSRGVHVDLRRVAPEGPSSIIAIDKIAAGRSPQETEDVSLQRFFRTPPLMSPRKVALVEKADRMNSSSGHSFLKMLEEPHPYAKLVLTTSALSSILPTIISRCVCIPVEQSSASTVSAASESIREIVSKIGRGPRAMALRLAEEFRQACSLLGEDEGNSARAAQAMALVELAQALLASFPEKPERAQAAIEAHRRIIGNGQASLVIDGLFAQLLS